MACRPGQKDSEQVLMKDAHIFALKEGYLFAQTGTQYWAKNLAENEDWVLIAELGEKQWYTGIAALKNQFLLFSVEGEPSSPLHCDTWDPHTGTPFSQPLQTSVLQPLQQESTIYYYNDQTDASVSLCRMDLSTMKEERLAVTVAPNVKLLVVAGNSLLYSVLVEDWCHIYTCPLASGTHTDLFTLPKGSTGGEVNFAFHDGIAYGLQQTDGIQTLWKYDVRAGTLLSNEPFAGEWIFGDEKGFYYTEGETFFAIKDEKAVQIPIKELKNANFYRVAGTDQGVGVQGGHSIFTASWVDGTIVRDWF